MDQMSDLKAAQDVHHRLEFYLVAVAFTIAGFAIHPCHVSSRPQP